MFPLDAGTTTFHSQALCRHWLMQQARVMQGARSTATRGIRKVAGTPSRLSAAGKRLASNLRGKTSAADKQLRASYTAGTPCMCSALHVVQMTLYGAAQHY